MCFGMYIHRILHCTHLKRFISYSSEILLYFMGRADYHAKLRPQDIDILSQTLKALSNHPESILLQ